MPIRYYFYSELARFFRNLFCTCISNGWSQRRLSDTLIIVNKRRKKTIFTLIMYLFTLLTVTLSFRNKNREQAEENEINQINIISQTNGHGSVHVYENNVQMESLPEQNVYNSLHIDQKIDHEYECMKK